MKKLKVFHSTRMTNELDEPETIGLMNEEINIAIETWLNKQKITDYEIVNSQLTNIAEFSLYGQFNPSQVILSTHISYLG